VDIGGVVPIVMDHHGLCVDVRLERIEGIAERGKLKRAIRRLRLGVRQAWCEKTAGGHQGGRAQELEAFASVHDIVLSGMGQGEGENDTLAQSALSARTRSSVRRCISRMAGAR